MFNDNQPQELPVEVIKIMQEIQSLLGDDYPITAEPLTKEDLENLE
nr:MAG TPA: hypothetical protein [Caudoviricetes sp.]